MVLVVLMLFASMVSPHVVVQIDAMKRRQAYGQVYELLQRARVNAITQQMTYQVTYDEAQTRLVLSRVSSSTEDPEEQSTVSLPSGISASNFVVESDNVPSSDWKLHFYADGKSEGGSLELQENQLTRGYRVKSDGSISAVEGSVDTGQDEIWQAGDYVIRS